jgi:hypothetical protein
MFAEEKNYHAGRTTVGMLVQKTEFTLRVIAVINIDCDKD